MQSGNLCTILQVKNNVYYLYIVRCADNSLYCGITTNLERRLKEHNSHNKKSAKYTRYKQPVVLVYSEKFTDRSSGLKKEWQIKKLSKKEKELLVRYNNIMTSLGEERVMVVDREAKELYEVSKKEAHEKGLLHKCVIAEVINSKGKMMLIKPYSHKQDAGQYVSPVGGHVSAGESDEEALKREVREEIGVTRFTFKLIGKASFDRHVLDRHENHYFVLYEIFTDEKPKLGDETESYKYFTRKELKKELQQNRKDFGDAYLFVVEHFYSELLLVNKK